MPACDALQKQHDCTDNLMKACCQKQEHSSLQVVLSDVPLALHTSTGCCSCHAGLTSFFLLVNKSAIFAWRPLQFLRTTASVAVSTRSLNGLGLRGEAGMLKGLAGDGAMGLRSQPANGTSGGGQSGTSAPGPYLTALQDLSTSGLWVWVKFALNVYRWWTGQHSTARR